MFDCYWVLRNELDREKWKKTCTVHENLIFVKNKEKQ